MTGMVVSARLSLIVYIKYIIINALVFVVMGAFFFFSGLSSGAFRLTIGFVSIVYWIVVILSVERFRIYANEQGIWARYGFFPWTKRVFKIDWSDLDEATYTPSMIGWILQSYTIKLKSYLLADNELVFRHVWRGKQFVEKINQIRLARRRR